MIKIGVVMAVVSLLAAGCLPRTPRNSDGAIEGIVDRVWEDGMTVDVGGGNPVRFDTWSVCGDATTQNIKVGEQVSVYADRDLFSYDAWRILDANGNPACDN